MRKIKLMILLLLVGVFVLTGCVDEEVNTNSTNNSIETNIKDYSGVYKAEDSSKMVIENKNVDISIYRLASFSDCVIDEVKDDVLYISGKDPNNETIRFTFDYNTKTLNVVETTWNLISTEDSFVFDK